MDLEYIDIKQCDEQKIKRSRGDYIVDVENTLGNIFSFSITFSEYCVKKNVKIFFHVNCKDCNIGSY